MVKLQIHGLSGYQAGSIRGNDEQNSGRASKLSASVLLYVIWNSYLILLPLPSCNVRQPTITSTLCILILGALWICSTRLRRAHSTRPFTAQTENNVKMSEMGINIVVVYCIINEQRGSHYVLY